MTLVGWGCHQRNPLLLKQRETVIVYHAWIKKTVGGAHNTENKHWLQICLMKILVWRRCSPWTPSWLQYLILPTRISSRKGWKTTYLKWTDRETDRRKDKWIKTLPMSLCGPVSMFYFWMRKHQHYFLGLYHSVLQESILNRSRWAWEKPGDSKFLQNDPSRWK